MIFFLAIPVFLLGLVLGLWIGVRYCAGTLLPRILARLSDEGLNALAEETAKERAKLQG